MRSMQIEHFVEDGQEFVVVDGDTKYLVDRQRQELHRLNDPVTTLPVVQRQVGHTANGALEVLERDCSDDGESVVVDASPDWLDEIGAAFTRDCETTRD